MVDPATSDGEKKVNYAEEYYNFYYNGSEQDYYKTGYHLVTPHLIFDGTEYVLIGNGDIADIYERNESNNILYEKKDENGQEIDNNGFPFELDTPVVKLKKNIYNDTIVYENNNTNYILFSGNFISLSVVDEIKNSINSTDLPDNEKQRLIKQMIKIYTGLDYVPEIVESPNIIKIFQESEKLAQATLIGSFNVKIAAAPKGLFIDEKYTFSMYKANDGRWYSYRYEYTKNNFLLAGIYYGDILIWVQKAGNVIPSVKESYYTVPDNSLPDTQPQKNTVWTYDPWTPVTGDISVECSQSSVSVSFPGAYSGRYDQWSSDGQYQGGSEYTYDQQLNLWITPFPSGGNDCGAWYANDTDILYYSSLFNQTLIDGKLNSTV